MNCYPSKIVMLSTFKIVDFRVLLETFGLDSNGTRSELLYRINQLLTTKPNGLNIAAFQLKIIQIFQSKQINLNSISNPRDFQPNQMVCTGQQYTVQNNTNQLTFYSRQSAHVKPPQNLNHYKFKKLPFYENIEEIIKLTPLNNSNNKCTLENHPKGMKENIFTLNMSVDQINMISLNRDISNPKQPVYPYQYQIRLCRIESECFEVTDYFPSQLHVRIGDTPCPLPIIAPNKLRKSIRTASPINCTHEFKLSPFIKNLIKVNWVPDKKNYGIAMNIVKQLSADNLIKKLQDKEARSSEDTKNEIIKKLTDSDPDLAITSFQFPLLCPLNKIRMKLPAKSVHCDHIKCFDAGNFIRMNEKKSTWLCPICKKSCLYDDIKIENYFLEIVTSSKLEDDDIEILINVDGSWEKVLKININNTIVTKAMPIELVNLDSDDEKSINPKKEPNSSDSEYQKSINLESLSVDLTIEEDNETQNNVQAVDPRQLVTTVELIEIHPQSVTSFLEEEEEEEEEEEVIEIL